DLEGGGQGIGVEADGEVREIGEVLAEPPERLVLGDEVRALDRGVLSDHALDAGEIALGDPVREIDADAVLLGPGCHQVREAGHEAQEQSENVERRGDGGDRDEVGGPALPEVRSRLPEEIDEGALELHRWTRSSAAML